MGEVMRDGGRGTKRDEGRGTENAGYIASKMNNKKGVFFKTPSCYKIFSSHAHVPRPFFVSRPYSTVTDLARFLGWSTLHPRITAM